MKDVHMQTTAQGIVKMVTHHHHIRSLSVRCNKIRKKNKNENLTGNAGIQENNRRSQENKILHMLLHQIRRRIFYTSPYIDRGLTIG